MAEVKVRRRTVEVRSFSDGDNYHIVVDGHHDVLLELSLPFHGRFNDFLTEAVNNYMPVMVYDENNSEIRQFDHNYVRIIHKMNFHKANEIRPIMRQQISDILLNAGWNLIGFGCHPGPIPKASTVVEKWTKVFE